MTRYARDMAERCDSASCFCSAPPVRFIPSTGQFYTVEELLAGSGAVRVFRYLYLPAVSA